MVGEIEILQEGGWTHAWISTIGRRHIGRGQVREVHGSVAAYQSLGALRQVGIYRAGCIVSVLEWNGME